LTKNNSFIIYLTLFLAINLPLLANSYSQAIKERSGSLQIALISNIPDVDVNFLEVETFVLEVEGRHFKRTKKIGKEGLYWQDVPENLYKLKLYNSKQKLEFTCTFIVKKGQKTQLEIHWVGNDYRTPAKPRIWILRAAGGWGQGVRWNYGSWQRTFRADGKVETYHQGIVFGRDHKQRVYSRFDWDNDLISDLDDRDDDNDGIYDSTDRDDDNDGVEDSKDTLDTDDDNDGMINELEVRDQVLGNLQYPIIESYTVLNLDSRTKGFIANPGDLLKLDFKINEAGGRPIDKMICRVFNNGTQSFHFQPLDDGSLEDLDEELAGRQISGDLISSDGNYSMILPLDMLVWRAIYPSIITCKALNLIGKESQEVFLFPGDSKDQPLPNSSSQLYTQIDSVGIKFFKNELENRAEKVDLELKLKKPLRVKVYLDQRSIFLEPTKKTLKFTDYSDSFTMPQAGLFFLSVADDDGGVFYLGEKVN
tara:strand:- start:45 stop:1481 length:1437 start_codon:yes stop_codon:yes gene_type:complete